MRYAIIADIHANLEAFNTVLADAQAMKCTHYACLGDVVGYNANPKECLDMVRATAERIAGAQFKIIPGVGHIPSIEQPELLAGLFNTFLSEVGHGR